MIDIDKLHIEKLVDSELYKQSSDEVDFDVSDLDKPIATELTSMKSETNQYPSIFDTFSEEYLKEAYEQYFTENLQEEFQAYLTDIPEGKWEELSDPEKEIIIKAWADFLVEKLELQNPPKLEIYYNEVPGECGNFNGESVRVNKYELKTPAEMFNTLAHEYWHAHQYERANNPKSFRDMLYYDNFRNYISPDVDYEGYYNQLLEVEARSFASKITSAISGVLKELE